MRTIRCEGGKVDDGFEKAARWVRWSEVGESVNVEMLNVGENQKWERLSCLHKRQG